ncbi:MAG TPA: zf-HC2 domain-containing protein [Terriglobia bacterium]|nr:zf-HC2 domain-containing protein [Terriglobia bacterium]
MKKETSCLEKEQIFYFVQGMMEAREAERVRCHLADCLACRQVTEGYQKLDLVLDSWRVGGPSAWFESTLQAKLASATDERRGFFGLPWGRWLAPASLAAMVVFGMVMVHPWRQPGRFSPPVAPTSSRPAQGVQVQSRPQAQPAPAASLQGADAKPADDELTLYKNLPVLENYDMLSNFDVLSELATADGKAAD